MAAKQISLPIILLLLASRLNADDLNENKTEVAEEAEFRQGGGIGQQLISGYPAMSSLYGSQYTSGSNGYVGNMLRNLYRPPSLGLTDKVKHWVKSFMNRRQQYMTKPYYNPSMSSLQYSPDEFGTGKPVFLGSGNGYKAISVPLRQLQKYYKPYYGESIQQQPSGSSSLLSYSNLYAPNSAGLFASGSSSAVGGGGGSSGSSSSQLFAGNDGLYAQQGEGAGSPVFASSNLYNSNPFQTSSGNSMFSLDSSSLFGPDTSSSIVGSSSYFGGSPSGSGSRGAPAPILGGSVSASDLYASGASSIATLYNPSQGEQSQVGYGSKKPSESALYMSSDHRNAEPYLNKESANSFNVDSSQNNSPLESSYSVAFHPSSSGSSSSQSGFQPVSFQGKSS